MLQTIPLSHQHGFLHDKAKQERDKSAQNIAQWEQQETHHHHDAAWINAEQTAERFRIAALSSEVTSPSEVMPNVTLQHIIAQAKRARFMATCAEVFLVDEGDKHIMVLVDSGAYLSAAPPRVLHRSQHLINNFRNKHA